MSAASSAGGARSCRRRRRRRPRPRSSSRRAAPRNSPSTRAASARGVAGELDRGQGDRRVLAVVLTRNRELELDRLELVASDGFRRGREPVGEERLDLGARGELAVVVEIDVRDHRDLGAKCGDRPVGLVSLDDEPALTRPRVAAELRHLAADQEGRVVAEPVEAERDHRGSRRLPVRAGDHDRRCRETSSARNSARGLPSAWSRYAVETTTSSQPSGTTGSGASSTGALPEASAR